MKQIRQHVSQETEKMTKKLKSSSIYYALFLSIVIALVLGSMVLFSGMNRQFASRLEMEELLMDNAVSGIEYAQANYAELPNRQPVDMRLFGEGIDSVRIEKKQWGAFTILKSTALHGETAYTKIALTGQVNQVNEPTLYVADQGRPIALCGDVRIEGRAMLPEAGLKRAYIEGKNYTGDKMIYGTLSKSDRNLPPVDDVFLGQVMAFEGEIKPWDKLEDSIRISFGDEGVHYISDGYTLLENVVVEGQVIIESRDSIFVGASAQLNDVILKSPVVYFQKGFTGTVQVFASRKIVLEDQVLLKYPSVLGLIEEEFPKEKNAEITLGAQSQVIGSVFLFSRAENFRLPVQLNAGKESEIDGLVYCKGKTQLEGTVNGHLYTEKFYLKTKASTYENHLLDAKVLDQLPADFIYVSLLKSTNQLTRLEWLN